MKLYPGQPAKPFNKLDTSGRPVRLEDYTGRFLLLVFYRNSACALCNLHLHRLIDWYRSREKALNPVAIFESPLENILSNYSGQRDIPFPLLPDPHGELYDLYGLESSASKIEASVALPQVQHRIEEAARLGFRLRKEEGSNFNRLTAEFLIGPDQTIQLAHYADYVTDHLPFHQIEHHLRAIQISHK